MERFRQASLQVKAIVNLFQQILRIIDPIRSICHTAYLRRYGHCYSFGFVVIVGIVLVFYAQNRPLFARPVTDEQVFLPLISSSSATNDPTTINYDFSLSSEEQLDQVRTAVTAQGLAVKQEERKLTIYREENDTQKTIIELTCTGRKCGKKGDGANAVAGADAQITTGLKITISLNGTRIAIVEQISRKLLILSLLENDEVVDIIQFQCHNCDIELNIPADVIEATPTSTVIPTLPPGESTATSTTIPATPATATPTTATPATATPTTATPTPTTESTTPTGTPTAVPPSVARSHWHAPGAHDELNVHEHGDAPPAWANAFSQTHFGHPVIFGGDESTPNENVLKHQAYKGFLMDASDASGVDVYIRYHAMSNPFGRTGPLHSYEIYGKDSAGNVSFWQGWNFYGYPELRSQRMTRRHEVGGVDGFPGRDQFIIAAPDQVDWDNFLRCEQWYGHGGQWAWDLSITICNATTFFTYDEHLTDIQDMSTWKPTGDLGDGRRLEVTHYGPANPNSAGVNLPFDQWFCAELRPTEHRESGERPSWNLSGAVAGPDACPDGWLPQFVADTFPKAGVYFQTGNTAEKDFPVPGVTLPN